MSRRTYTEHSAESLGVVRDALAESLAAIEAVISAMRVHGCDSLTVNYQKEMERGLSGFRSFADDVGSELLKWRREQGHFRPQSKPAEPPAKEKKPAKK